MRKGAREARGVCVHKQTSKVKLHFTMSACRSSLSRHTLKPPQRHSRECTRTLRRVNKNRRREEEERKEVGENKMRTGGQV